MMLTKDMSLDRLFDVAVEASRSMEGVEVDWRRKEGSLAFAKICLTTLSLLKIYPKSTHYSTEDNLDAWDVSSAASLCRNIIEAYFAMFYLAADAVEPSVVEWRRSVWTYHHVCETLAMVQTALPESQHLDQLKRDHEKFQNTVKAHAAYSRLTKAQQTKLLKGTDCLLLPVQELCRRARISHKYYKATYKYLSNFTHTTPYGLGLLDAGHHGSQQAEAAFDLIATISSQFLALGLRDYVSLTTTHDYQLPEDVVDYVDSIGDLLLWEESPTYNQVTEMEKRPWGHV